MSPASGGRSLLFLLPGERGPMLGQLEAAKVPLKPLKVNPGRSQPVGPALQALLSKNAELKVCAQSASSTCLCTAITAHPPSALCESCFLHMPDTLQGPELCA